MGIGDNKPLRQLADLSFRNGKLVTGEIDANYLPPGLSEQRDCPSRPTTEIKTPARTVTEKPNGVPTRLREELGRGERFVPTSLPVVPRLLHRHPS